MERLDGILARVLADVSAGMSRGEKDAAFARQSGRKIAGDETGALMHPVVCPAGDTRPAPRGGGPKTTGGNDRRIVQRGR